jgi:hypothetical protein
MTIKAHVYECPIREAFVAVVSDVSSICDTIREVGTFETREAAERAADIAVARIISTS